jgi:hypothetical protein
MHRVILPFIRGGMEEIKDMDGNMVEPAIQESPESIIVDQPETDEGGEQAEQPSVTDIETPSSVREDAQSEDS